MKQIFLLSIIGLHLSIAIQAQVSKTLILDAGNLTNSITAEEKNTITNLTLSGTIDARDFKIMRDSMPLLAEIDLSGTSIVAYEGAGGTSIWNNNNYPANEIPESAFMNKNWEGKNSLVSFKFPPEITIMNKFAFYECNNLTSAPIPLSVKVLSQNVFTRCYKLSDIDFPEGLEVIGNQAFYGCNGTYSLNIPSSVTTIEGAALLGWYGLITVDENNANFSCSEGVLFNKEKTEIILCPRSKTGDFIIPQSVETIKNNTFSNCSGLTSIIIPSNVTLIENNAFWGCRSLTTLDIPSSVVEIQGNAFGSCTNLTALYTYAAVPVDLTDSYRAFENTDQTACTLYVPSGSKTAYEAAIQWQDFENIIELEVTNTFNVTAGGLSAILSAEQLDTITILSLVGNIDARDFKIMRDSMPLLEEVDLSGVTVEAYSGTEGTVNSDFDYSVDAIPKGAFYSLTGKLSLISVVLPNTITAIEANSFDNCRNLTTINLPISLQTIHFYAFGHCISIDTLKVFSSVSNISDFAFAYSKFYVIVDENNPNYSSDNGVLYDKTQTQILWCPGSKTGSFTIPGTVKTIRSGAFANCTEINSISIPPSVSFIGGWAFDFCSNLTFLEIPAAVDYIGTLAFRGCSNINELYVFNSTLCNLGDNVFSGMSLTTCILYVPSGSKDAYVAANQWQDFENIVEMGDTIDEKRASKSLIADFTVDNIQGTVPFEVHFQDLSKVDTTVINLFSPLSGLNIYYIKAVSDLGAEEWNFSSESFSNLGSIENTITIDKLKLYAYPDKRMEVDANYKSLDSMVFTSRLKFGGSGSFDENGLPLGRVVSFKVLGNTQVTIICMSSSSSEDRTLLMTAEDQHSQIAQIPAYGGFLSKSEANYNPEITSWLWNFGDGNFSTEQNPTHTYYSAGNYDVELIVSNSLFADTLLKSSYILAENSSDCPQHFHPVWEGTSGYDHMNINIFNAQLDGMDLQPGDEIGIFDGDLCVGYGKVEQTVDLDNVLFVVVSRDDGTGNGYITGNNITYKFWDCSASAEFSAPNALYFNNLLQPVDEPTFNAGATAFVELSGTSQTEISMDLHFSSGWNLFSAPVHSDTSDMTTLFQPLIDYNSLVKIQDEQGNSLENLGIFGGWVNNIGDISPTEGYKIKVYIDGSLTVCGMPVAFPFSIPLTAGWNIAGYPQQTEVEGMAIVQHLINRGTLIKVQDEAGKSIENLGIFGGWQNNIGNFIPGEGYKFKVASDDTLWISESYTKSTIMLPEPVATTHFIPVYEGNGVDHMNINLVELPANLIQPGDEFAVFDGNLCVGAVTVLPYHLGKGTVSIAASSMDSYGIPGFAEGNEFTLKVWNVGQNMEYILIPDIISGTTWFDKNESTLASLEKYIVTGFNELFEEGDYNVKCYPNPFSEEITIEFVLSNDSKVNAEVINQLGQRIKYLSNNRQLTKGVHRLRWDGTNADNGQVVPGIYYLKLEINDVHVYRKIVLSK